MPDGSQAPVSSAIVTLPNVISFARICAVPVAVWLVLDNDFAAAFALFVLAGLSDALDGYLARRFTRSKLGALLDPVADKLLMVAMYVTLAATARLPAWLTILVVFRDLLIVGGVLVFWLVSHPVHIHPFALSKINTALQIVLVAAVLFAAAFGIIPPTLLTALVWTVAATTLITGAIHVWRGVSAQ